MLTTPQHTDGHYPWCDPRGCDVDLQHPGYAVHFSPELVVDGDALNGFTPTIGIQVVSGDAPDRAAVRTVDLLARGRDDKGRTVEVVIQLTPAAARQFWTHYSAALTAVEADTLT